jgi:hypothetical protein
VVAVVAVVVAAAGGIQAYSNRSALVVAAVPADACVRSRRHRAYASPTNSPGNVNTTLACVVHRWRFAEIQWYQ